LVIFMKKECNDTSIENKKKNNNIYCSLLEIENFLCTISKAIKIVKIKNIFRK
jgi:hypothetical protein